jgi:DNA-binding CsgD family transcriptional regulator
MMTSTLMNTTVNTTPSTTNLLVRAVVESWIDGVLVLTSQGDWVHANETARRICSQLSPNSSKANVIPDCVWQVCQLLMQMTRSHPEASNILETEVTPEDATIVRIRVRWFNLDDSQQPYLLVMLEDRYQSIQNLAIAEVDRYDLTPREAEVWLLYRQGYSYKAIAQELFIALDTVKKHLKHIRNKQSLAWVGG